jgi:hypothetical protein
LATALSLFATHSKRQAGDFLDDDCVTSIGTARTDGLPALAANPDLPLGSAVRHGHAFRTDESLCSDRRLPPP